MKAKLILTNFALSLCALTSINTEQSALGAVAIIVLWFVASAILLIRANKRGWMNEIAKQ